MPSCSVKWCSNHTSTCSLKSKNGVSFHRFPKDEAICQKWVKAVRHERRDPWWTSSNASRICSLHFKESDISSTPCKVNILSKTAVPVCTMVWYDENQNNITSKTSEKTNTDITYRKTDEHKNTHVNVLRESKVNIFNKFNEEGTTISETNKAVDSNITPKLLSQVKLKEFLEFHNIASISLTTSANEVTRKSVRNELNEKEYPKSFKEKYRKLKINDNTSFILDDDLCNDIESSIFTKEPNIRTCENSLKVTLNECKSNENRKPYQNITNISNKDEIVETKNIYNGDSNANILNKYEYKQLKTYMPKRKNKINEIKVKGTCEHLTVNDDIMSIDSEKDLNAIKCIEGNNNNVNINPNNDLKFKFSATASPNSNITWDLQSNRNAQDKNEPCAFKNLNIVNTPTIINQHTTVCKESNVDTNKETKIVNLDEFITNQSRIDNINGNEKTVYDEIISELFENSKHVSDISNSNCLESNENVRVDKYFMQFDENTLTKSHQQLAIMNNNTPTENSDFLISKSHYDLNSESNRRDIMQLNKNMYYSESNTNIENVLSTKKLQRIKTSVSNIDTDSNKDKFTELRKHLTSKPKLDSLADLCTNIITHINKNLFSKSNEIMSTVLTKENPQVSYPNHAEYDKHIELNNKLASLQTNVNTEGTKGTESTVTKPKQLISILPEEFLTNLSPVSNYRENVDFANNLITDPYTITEPELNKRNTSVVNTELQQNTEKDMPKLDTAINLDFSSEVHIGLNDKINTKDVNTELQQNRGKNMPKLDSVINFELCSEFNIELKGEINTADVNKVLKQNPEKDMPDLDKIMNLELCSEVNIGLNDEINKADANTKLKQNPEKDMPDLDFVMDLELCSEVNIGLNDEINTADVSIELIENPGKDTVSELIKNPHQKSKKDMNRKFNNINIEMCYNKDLLLRKSNKNVENVLPLPDDQLIVVNEHLDVVDSILNRDTVAEFDLSLLLTDTPIPDEEIQNVDSNSNNNLDATERNSNWIKVAADEIPKIIDHILDEAAPVLENFELYEKVNDLDKVVHQKNNNIKKPIKENSTNSNFEQIEEILANTSVSLKQCTKNIENVQQCSKNSITQTEKLINSEFSNLNKASLKQSNINEVSRCEIIAKKCYDLCHEPNDKQSLEQYLQLITAPSNELDLDQNVECYEKGKEIQESNKNINQSKKQQNSYSKANKLKDSSIKTHFEESKESHKEQDNAFIIENVNKKVLNYGSILEVDKKHYDKKFDKETYKSRVDKLITVAVESVKKTKIQNQGNLKSSFQEINKQLSEDFDNKKRMYIVKNISNEAQTQGTKSMRELDSEHLQQATFEQCCQKCGSNCKNKKLNSNNELYNEDVQHYKNSSNYTPYQSDNKNHKRDIDLFNKLQYNQSSVDTLVKQLNFESFKPNIKQTPLIEHHKLSDNEKCITKCKKIAIDQMSGKYLELRWQEKEEHSNNLSQNNCKRKRKELGCKTRKIQRTESTSEYKCLSTKRRFDLSNNNCENQNGSFSQVMAECPECGYTTDDIDLTTYKSDVDLRISKPLSLINKDMFLSQPDRETEDNNQNNGNNKRVALESVYAMELAYATAIQALERKLKQKIAISEYRQKKVNNLSKINDNLIKANILLMNVAGANKL